MNTLKSVYGGIVETFNVLKGFFYDYPSAILILPLSLFFSLR